MTAHCPPPPAGATAVSALPLPHCAWAQPRLKFLEAVELGVWQKLRTSAPKGWGPSSGPMSHSLHLQEM